jgi:hypothetical protein
MTMAQISLGVSTLRRITEIVGQGNVIASIKLRDGAAIESKNYGVEFKKAGAR